MPKVAAKCARCDLYSFDEVHHAMANVFFPASEAELAEILANVPAGRTVTVRGGGQALYIQSLNDDLVVTMTGKAFSDPGVPKRDEEGFYITSGAGARWWDVIKVTSVYGLMPPSLVSAGHSTVGGTLASDGVSRMSPFVGKEGKQIRSFKIMLADGSVDTFTRHESDPARARFFKAVIGSFGALGVVLEVTFDLVVARSNPGVCGDKPFVLTRSTRHGNAVDWDELLRSLQAKSEAGAKRFDRKLHLGGGLKAGEPDLARTPEWSALSIAGVMTGQSMSANLLEQRYVDPPQILNPLPSGMYDANAAFPPNGERTLAVWPTLVELGIELGFPEGEFVDELFGWAFFLHNSTTAAKQQAHESGYRINFTQQSFALPSHTDGRFDTRPMQRFIEQLETRLHEADVRAGDVDFLYIPADDFLMSASNGLDSFVITVAFVEKDRTEFSPEITDTLRALSRDCRMLGGRVHLVKGVYADRADLRAMYGTAATELRRLKAIVDPRNIFRNAFFEQVFNA